MRPVDDDSRTGTVRGIQVLAALVVAEKMNPVARKFRPQREVELACGDHVQPKSFLGDEPQELGRGKSLGGIEDLPCRSHRGDVFGRALTHRRFVVDVQGRSVLVSQLDEVATAHLHVAGGVDPVRDRVQQASALVRAGAAGAA